MLAADMTRAKRAERRDALAACWILQSFLDYLQDHHITADTKQRHNRPVVSPA